MARTATTEKAVAPKATPKAKSNKVVFEHDNQFLYVADVDVQFMYGKYETDNETEIAVLRNVYGVRIAD